MEKVDMEQLLYQAILDATGKGETVTRIVLNAEGYAAMTDGEMWGPVTATVDEIMNHKPTGKYRDIPFAFQKGAEELFRLETK